MSVVRSVMYGLGSNMLQKYTGKYNVYNLFKKLIKTLTNLKVCQNINC